MKKVCGLVGFLTLVLASNASAAPSAPCARGESLHAAAMQAIAAYRDDEGLALLHKVASTCDRHGDWQHLGEQLVELGEDREDQAADAFVRAYDLAQTDAERGIAVAHYAVLLLHSGDPQRALSFMRQAKSLDPDSAYTKKWFPRIEQRAQTLNAEDVVRGLGDMAFKPMVLNKRLNEQELDGSAGTGGAGVVTVKNRRVEIPLYFETNSTRLDAVTNANLRVLGSTLASPQFAEYRFEFVGHADLRGEAAENLVLSKARASAIVEAVLNDHPALAGRIDPIGRGEQQPVEFGDSDAAHRANRRLEVIAYVDEAG